MQNNDTNIKPDDIDVHNNSTFRDWCSSMQLNPRQASAILKLSLPMVYKYIDPNEKNKIRDITSLACNLISEKAPDERLQWLQNALTKEGCVDPWPANSPIVSTSVMVKH